MNAPAPSVTPLCACYNHINNAVKHLAAFIRVLYKQCKQSNAWAHAYTAILRHSACIVSHQCMFCAFTQPCMHPLHEVCLTCKHHEWTLFTGMYLQKHTHKTHSSLTVMPNSSLLASHGFTFHVNANLLVAFFRSLCFSLKTVHQQLLAVRPVGFEMQWMQCFTCVNTYALVYYV